MFVVKVTALKHQISNFICYFRSDNVCGFYQCCVWAGIVKFVSPKCITILYFLVICCLSMAIYTTATTVVLLQFVRDHPGESVPEETFTHPPILIISQTLSASSIYYDSLLHWARSYTNLAYCENVGDEKKLSKKWIFLIFLKPNTNKNKVT